MAEKFTGETRRRSGANVSSDFPMAKLMAAILSAPPDGARPDILLCDIAMSEEDGYAALRRAPALQSDSVGRVDGAQRQRRTVARDERGLMHISITKPVDPVSLNVISNIVEV